jgi:hypothetical protein
LSDRIKVIFSIITLVTNKDFTSPRCYVFLLFLWKWIYVDTMLSNFFWLFISLKKNHLRFVTSLWFYVVCSNLHYVIFFIYFELKMLKIDLPIWFVISIWHKIHVQGKCKIFLLFKIYWNYCVFCYNFSLFTTSHLSRFQNSMYIILKNFTWYVFVFVFI